MKKDISKYIFTDYKIGSGVPNYSVGDKIWIFYKNTPIEVMIDSEKILSCWCTSPEFEMNWIYRVYCPRSMEKNISKPYYEYIEFVYEWEIFNSLDELLEDLKNEAMYFKETPEEIKEYEDYRKNYLNEKEEENK